MHLLTCLACGEATDSGPTVAGKLRPMCGDDLVRWMASGENVRGDAQAEEDGVGPIASSRFARAFMDWLTRVRAERRSAGKVAG